VDYILETLIIYSADRQFTCAAQFAVSGYLPPVTQTCCQTG